jgi:PAS domain S-box-containing protein
MTTDILLESIRLCIFIILLLFLVWGVRLTKHVQLRGRKFLILGTVFVVFSAAMDILDEFEIRESFLSALTPGTYDLLEEIGSIMGFALLSVGLLLMMHSIFVALSAKKNVDLQDERFRLIVENISDIVFLIDLNFNWLYITPSVEKFRGYTAEEAINQNIRDVLTRESIRKVRRIVRKEILNDSKPGVDPGRTRILELEFYHRNGSTVWGEVTATFLRDEGGHIIGIQGVNRDVTSRKKAEQAIRESEERFRTAFMLSPEAAALNRMKDGKFVEVNRKFLEQTGFKQDEVRGKSGLDHKMWANTDERDRFREIIFEKGTVENFEAHFKMKNGETGIGLISGAIVSIAGEKQVLTIIKDITETRRAQMALEESEEKYRSTLEAIGDCVRIINSDFEVIWANDIALSKLGTKVGSKCYEIIQNPDRQCDDCITSRTFMDGQIHTREMRFERDHETMYALSTCSPIRSHGGKVTAVVETFKDITGIKEVEARLRNTIYEKESLVKEVHHRVKNNLQAISGLLNIQAIRSEDQKLGTAIRESQNRILSIAMIHEHLYHHHNLSKIDFTSYTETLVSNIQRSYDLDESLISVDVRGQTIILNTDTAIPCGLILTELVSNCFKHAFQQGQNGKVEVELENLGDGRYSLVVRDNGKGLPPDIDVHATDSFGIMLIRTFTDLLRGVLEFEQGEETVFRVIFSEYKEANELVFQ